MVATTTNNKIMNVLARHFLFSFFSSVKKHNLLTLLTAITCLGATPIAFALASDASAPIDIQSDTVSVDNKNQQATYTGNVFIKQGSINIRADKVVIKANKGRLQSANIYGSKNQRASFEQTTDQGELIKGRALRIDMHQSKNLIKLTNKAELNDGTNTLTGPSISYNSKKQTIMAKSSKKERVKMTFLPPESTNDSSATDSNTTGN